MDVVMMRCENCGKTNRIPKSAVGKPRCGNCRSALPWIVEAGDDNFADVAEKSAMFVLVDFWAPWCGPCRMVSPALEQLARERAGLIKLVKVNVDTAPTLSQRFMIQAVPTLMVLDRGEVLSRQAGAAPVAALRSWLDAAIGNASRSTGNEPYA